MLIAVASVKGAPGVTSTALTLAATWTRPVLLVEADPSGGDVAVCCTSAAGGPLAGSPGLLSLAAAVREDHDPGALTGYGQELGCGVTVLPGVVSPGQAAGLTQMWPSIARACRRQSAIDVIVDLGRLAPGAPQLPIAAAADQLVLVCTPAMAEVVHLRETGRELQTALARRASADGRVGAVELAPLLVDIDRYAAADCADVDDVLATAGVPARPATHLTHDAAALERLQAGETAGSRLGRTLLIRSARAVVDQVAPPVDEPPREEQTA